MKYLYMGILLFVTGAIHAQDCSYTLSGSVKDFHDGNTLFNAVVELVGQNKYATTDFDGSYILAGLCQGTYTVKVSHPECEVKTATITLDSDTSLDFKLEHHAEALQEVTVTGDRFTKETTSGSEYSLSQEKLEDFSAASLGDAIQDISGVSSLNTGSTVVKPVIHGLHSSRIAIINNGVRLEDQEWGVEHAPNLDLNSAAHVSVVKGASALRYGGDAVGGVIIVDSRKAPLQDTLYGKTILNAASNGRAISASSSITKAYREGWYGMAQGTLKYAGDLESPDYILSNTGVRERDFSVGVGLNKFEYGFDAYYSYYDSEVGILRASHIGSVSDLVRAINSNEPLFRRDFSYTINAPKQDVKHHLAKLSAFKRFEKAGKLSLDYSFQLNNRKEFDIRRGDDSDKPSLDLRLSTHTVNSNFKWDSNSKFTVNFGTTLSYQENFPNPNTGIRRLIPDYEMYTVAGYSTIDYNISDNLTVDAGLRYDFIHIDAKKYYLNSRWEERGYEAYFGDDVLQELESQLLVNPVFDYHNFSATVGLNYLPTEAISLKANLSTASRAPNPAELFSDGLHHSAAIIELGDLLLDAEQSLKGIIELSGDFNRFSFTVNPYYNLISDFIILEPNGLQYTNRGAFPVYEYNQVDARLYGIDVQGSYRFTNELDLNSSFAYVNGKDRDREQPLIDMPAPSWTNTLTWYKKEFNNFKLGLRSEAVFKQNRFPDNDFEVTFINSMGQEVTQEVLVSQSPAAYHLMHFNASIDFNVKSNSILTLGFYVDNLFNTPYRDYLNRQRYFVDDLGRNFRIQLKLNY